MHVLQEIEIRRFKEKDAQSVCEIFLHAFKSKLMTLTSLSDEKLLEFLIDVNFADQINHEGFFVATKDDDVLGVINIQWKNHPLESKKINISTLSLIEKYGLLNLVKCIIGATLLTKKQRQDEGYIDFVGVHPKARKMGIGTKLINHCKEFCSNDLKLSKCTLYVASSNTKAIALYKRLGFERVNTTKSFLSKYLFNEKELIFMCANIEKAYFSIQS